MTQTQRKPGRGQASPNPFTPPVEITAPADDTNPHASSADIADAAETPKADDTSPTIKASPPEGDEIVPTAEASSPEGSLKGDPWADVAVMDVPDGAKVTPMVEVSPSVLAVVKAAFDEGKSKFVPISGWDGERIADFVKEVRKARTKFEQMTRIRAVPVDVRGVPCVKITTSREAVVTPVTAPVADKPVDLVG